MVFFGKEVPFATQTKRIELAQTGRGVRVAEPARIDLVKLGWIDGVPI